MTNGTDTANGFRVDHPRAQGVARDRQEREAGRRPVTSRDLLDLRFAGDPRLAPGGDRVVWVERWIDADRNQYRSNLYAAPASGDGVPAPLTTGPGSDRAPRWSPDGRWLAFLSDRPLPPDARPRRRDEPAASGGGAGAATPAARPGRGGEDKPRPQLYVLPSGGGEARLLTLFKQGSGPAVWSPDGRYVATIVQVHPERGLEASGDPEPGEGDPYRRFNRDVKVVRRLRYKLDGVGYFTEHRHHVVVLDLGPDGAHLAAPGGSEPPGDGGNGAARDAGTGGPGGKGAAAAAAVPGAEAHPAALVPLARVTAGEYDVRAVAWMPSGRELVVVTNPHPDADRQPWTDVYVVSLPATGPEGEAGGGSRAGAAAGAATRLPLDLSRDPLPAGVRKLTSSDIDVYEALPSPDGRWIAVRGQDARRYRAYSNTHLYLIAADGSQRRCLTAEADLTVGDESVNDVVGEAGATLAWAPDGSGLYALVSRRGEVQLYWFGVDGTIRPLTGGPQVLRGISLDREGRRCAYLRLTATDPGEIWVADLPALDEPAAAPPAAAARDATSAGPGASAAGAAAWQGAARNGHPVLTGRRLSRANDGWLARIQVVEPEHFTFESDGNVLDGWLIRPVGFEPGKKYPAILQIHGGPMAMYGYAFFHEFQLLAARGYAVFYTNPRGSQGYGQAFCAAIRGDWGNRDYRDLMTFVDAVLERYDFIDRQRLGVAGGSYGGYMTNWIVTHTDRFRAGVTMRCVANEHSFFGTSDIGFYDLFDLDLPPWEDPLRYLEMSPIHHIARCKTPLLVMHAEMDLRCPIEQAEQIYTALKVLGVPTEFVRFPDESHGLSRGGQPWHRVYRLDRIVDWFDRYLKPEPAPAAGRAEERAAPR
ncbi:S9 family peptidase [Thermaerobacter subterraneus]|uniref:Dipeptidyl aminopeptidase/acylaminoacyl peptidase n=1 Tax=Thermaerobacter subterraneus DSM 13965 TaxID=867903 RepID=K6PMY2_9FIRM|nr:S9 family peptidase [Thermaerobacter subterraneus]EKP94262.1 dipeptidyl aminopeptidase/acylaminoacyl peptidase [Thermaerobacter subterraneus DSM 13965]